MFRDMAYECDALCHLSVIAAEYISTFDKNLIHLPSPYALILFNFDTKKAFSPCNSGKIWFSL